MNTAFSSLRRPILDREQIKYAAMVTMFLNHFAAIFLTEGSFLNLLLSGIGYFTAPVMCYFLTEGFRYTGDRKKYGLRLLCFGLISQLPFYLAFHDYFSQVVHRPVNLNIMFTLFTCFLILAAMEYMMPGPAQFCLVAALAGITVFMDWAILAPLMVILFKKAEDDPRLLPAGFLVPIVMTSYFNLADGSQTLSNVLCMVSGPILAAVCILFLYNGRKDGGIGRRKKEKASAFSKWFFYLFYPCHLLFLWALHRYLQMSGTL